ncbi:MAG: phosphoribosylamine--glycine ligase [Chitinophagaceae bacterium]|nr:phosphoribosylamine--glycine ligase [Chitinophagaceae bacterium]
MNILIAGGGGREHALAWKFKQSSLCNNLYIAPGNAGTASLGTNVAIAVTDFETLASFCHANKIDMLFVGPEEPLVKGIYDYFKTNPSTAHIQVIGPSKDAAQLEGSKAFAKEFMLRNNIPTAAYREFNENDYPEGITYIKNHDLPIVLKADGLAAGKGVIICNNHIEALAEFELMIQQAKFGDAGKKVVIEEFLKGIELSVFALTDGVDYVMLPEAKDYKRVGKGDTGANTGGMGAVSPVPFADAVFLEKVKQKVVEPTITGLQKEKLDYKGIVFIGLIKVNDEPYVIEYNCRLGDPETEVVIPRIDNDLVELFSAVAEQRLQEITILTNPQTAVTVVAVSGGYPGNYQAGKIISGLEDAAIEGSVIFHAGTKQEGEDVLTNGGRILSVTSYGDNIADAVGQSIYVLENIYYDGMYFRDDIGFEFR